MPLCFSKSDIIVPPNYGRLTDWDQFRASSVGGNIWIKYEVCGASTAKVGVAVDCHLTKEIYTFCAGANGNVNGVIKKSDKPVARVFQQLLDRKEYRPFWIQIRGGHMAMGTGTELGQNVVVAHVDAEPFAVKYVTFTSGDDPVKYRSIKIGSDDAADITAPAAFEVAAGGAGAAAQQQPAFVQLIEEQLSVLQARAEKFGTPLDPLNMRIDQVVPYSQARMLLSNPTPGFSTGFDMETAEEKSKRERRMARFAGKGLDPDAKTPAQLQEEREAADVVERDERIAEEARRLERVSKFGGELVPVALSTFEQQCVDACTAAYRVDPAREGFDGADHTAAPRPSVVHVFAIDQKAFKVIKTPDLMAHFKDYGPTYCEWLGDTSCNLHFQDEYTCARVLSQLVLPAVYSEGNGGAGSMGADGGDDEVVEMGEEGAAVAAEPPHVMGYRELNAHGWKVGTAVVKGTTRVRVLLRVATADDVLSDRPVKVGGDRKKKGFKRDHSKGRGRGGRARRGRGGGRGRGRGRGRDGGWSGAKRGRDGEDSDSEGSMVDMGEMYAQVPTCQPACQPACQPTWERARSFGACSSTATAGRAREGWRTGGRTGTALQRTTKPSACVLCTVRAVIRACLCVSVRVCACLCVSVRVCDVRAWVSGCAYARRACFLALLACSTRTWRARAARRARSS
jgi:hypothetical protein